MYWAIINRERERESVVDLCIDMCIEEKRALGIIENYVMNELSPWLYPIVTGGFKII